MAQPTGGAPGEHPPWCNPHLHIITHRHQIAWIGDTSTYMEILLREHSGRSRIRVTFGTHHADGFDLTAEQAELIAAHPVRFARALAEGVALLTQG